MSNFFDLTQLNPPAQTFPTGSGLSAPVAVCLGHITIGSGTLNVYVPNQFQMSNISVLGNTASVSLTYDPQTDNWNVVAQGPGPVNANFWAIPQPLNNWNGNYPAIQFCQVVSQSNNTLVPGGNSLQLCTYESSWYDDKIQLLATWVPNCPVIGLDANA